jgi:hypothetical protein
MSHTEFNKADVYAALGSGRAGDKFNPIGVNGIRISPARERRLGRRFTRELDGLQGPRMRVHQVAGALRAKAISR